MKKTRDDLIHELSTDWLTRWEEYTPDEIGRHLKKMNIQNKGTQHMAPPGSREMLHVAVCPAINQTSGRDVDVYDGIVGKANERGEQVCPLCEEMLPRCVMCAGWEGDLDIFVEFSTEAETLLICDECDYMQGVASRKKV